MNQTLNTYRTIESLVGRLTDATTVVEPLSPQFVTTAITADSRKVVPGAVFVAVRGTAVDGHQFIPNAIRSGAALIVCNEFNHPATEGVAVVTVDDTSHALGLLASHWHGNPSKALTLVGVTGTNGKTTIATLLYELARRRNIKAGLLSTVANRINDLTVPATHTTPDPVSLNALLLQMVMEGCEFVAMEVSSHAADQQRIAGLDFDGAVFTNLTRDHLDYHKTFLNYLRAKNKFFLSLKPNAFALTNIDDRNGLTVVQGTKARVFSYSLFSHADFRAKVISDHFGSMEISLNGKEAHLMFSGQFNAYNLTAVYGTACLLGWGPDDSLLVDMSSLKPVRGRFETVLSPNGITAIIDYAHTPDALQNVLSTINSIRQPHQQIITVVGCGGDRDRGKRPMMALAAVNGSDHVILTSDNPRSENPDDIIDDMKAGLTPQQLSAVDTVADRRQAIRHAASMALPDDIILIAGKGHETYQIVGDITTHFDDREEIVAAFNTPHHSSETN